MFLKVIGIGQYLFFHIGNSLKFDLMNEVEHELVLELIGLNKFTVYYFYLCYFIKGFLFSLH